MSVQIFLAERLLELERYVRTLEAKILALERENKELKDRLNLNSTNSSLPSSRDLYKIKRQNRPASGKKPGAQVGHKGVSRDPMVPHETISLKLRETRCACGGVIKMDPKPHVFQKIDIPPIEPIVTEYHLHKGSCARCRRRYKAGLPEGVTPDLMGPRLKSAVTSLTGFFRNSKRDVQQILSDLFGVKISLGTVSNTEKRVSQKCRAAYDDLVRSLPEADHLHIDESGHRRQGRRYWAWMFTNPESTVLKLHQSRGMKVLREMLPGFCGVAISDRYPAYNRFSVADRQVCWAHLLRDFERFAHSSFREVGIYGRCLRSQGRKLFQLKRSHDRGKISDKIFARRAYKIRGRVLWYLQGLSELDEGALARNSARLMLKVEDAMWRFLEDPARLPLTNNLAERQLRHYVVYRKKSLFTWSDRGDRYVERLTSLYLTWRQNRENPFTNLHTLVAAA